MIEHDWALDFANHWITTWNAQDIEGIFGHYSDDFEMRSPYIRHFGVAAGILKGKTAIRPYWERGLESRPRQEFALKKVLIGVDSIAIYYRSVTHRKLVVEVLTFNEQLQVVAASAHYASEENEL
jgi:hypothetical protein